MSKILSCCGYRCDLCPAHRDNVTGPEHQQRISDGWRRVYGYNNDPQGVYCDGCRDMRENAVHMNEDDCAVRVCVLKKGIPNCAHCSDYPCDKAKEKPQRRCSYEHNLGRALTDEEYRLYVQPYESDRYLQQERNADEDGANP